MLKQAWVVLERAQPTRREETLFRALGALVWAALTLTVLYLGARLALFSPSLTSGWVARAIAVLYGAILPLLLLNARLVRKLWSAIRAERMHEPSLRAQVTAGFRTRWRAQRLVSIATFLLSGVGLLVGGLGVLGIVLELFPDGQPVPANLTLWSTAVAFGLSCLLIRFIARGRQRIAAINELRQRLLANQTAGNESQLAPKEYDAITRIERAQITADRRRSVRSSLKEPLDQAFSLREHRAFREAKVPLGPETLVSVQACLDQIVANPDSGRGVVDTPGRPRRVQVTGTDLHVTFVVDQDAREIRVLSLDSGDHEADGQP
jgi:hypothetical protein